MYLTIQQSCFFQKTIFIIQTGPLGDCVKIKYLLMLLHLIG